MDPESETEKATVSTSEVDLKDLLEAMHKTQVLVEKLAENIQQVAEGVSANRELMLSLHRESLQEMQEVRDVLNLSHKDLDQRMTTSETRISSLKVRVGRLEATG